MGKKFIFLICTIISSIFLGIATTAVEFKMILFVVIAACFFIVSISNIKYGIALILLVRSSLDTLTDKTIPGLNLNIASLFAMYCICLTVAYILINRIYIKNNIIFSYIAFILICAVSVLIPSNYHKGMVDIFKYVSMLSVYTAVLYLCRKYKDYGEMIMRYIIFSAVVPLSVGVYQIIFKKGYTTGYISEIGLNRVNATFVHPNSYAFYLLIIIVAIFLYNQRYKKNLFFIFLEILSLIELYFTYTRGSWLGLAVIIIGSVLLSNMELNKKVMFMVLILIIGIPIAAITSARFTNVLSSNVEASSLAIRVYIWKGMFNLFKEQPMFGYGMGSFEYLNSIVLKLQLNAHNDYLRLLIETGVFGLISFICLQVNALISILKCKNNNYIIVAVTLISFCLLSFGDNIIDMTVCEWYLWSLIAIYTASGLDCTNRRNYIQNRNI